MTEKSEQTKRLEATDGTTYHSMQYEQALALSRSADAQERIARALERLSRPAGIGLP